MFLEKIATFLGLNSPVTEILNEHIEVGEKVLLTEEMKAQLIERNLPQYKFLLDKFGTSSFPATWIQNLKTEFPEKFKA